MAHIVFLWHKEYLADINFFLTIVSYLTTNANSLCLENGTRGVVSIDLLRICYRVTLCYSAIPCYGPMSIVYVCLSVCPSHVAV